MTPPDDLRWLRPWVTFAGVVLVVVVLSWAKAVLVPLALAALLTFVLAPLVTGLERWIGRVAAVLVTVTLVFTALGLAVWGFTLQLGRLAEDLPRYSANIHDKIEDLRGVGERGPVQQLQRSMEEIATDLGGGGAKTGKDLPAAVPVVPAEPAGAIPHPAWLDGLIEPLGIAAVVVALVIFMLLGRRDLRDRLLGLFGHGHLALTTKAFDEAGRRVSRQLLMQTLVNLIYGVAIGTGLYFIGVPYPWLWGALAGVLRFIPYVGPVLGACAPILVSLGALEGWRGPLLVVALFIGLELFTNLVLETVLYAGAAGVSPVALLVSVAFWTWLWGPLGLLMSTPLTVCLVVLGKHVRGLEIVGTLMSDTHVLAPELAYYQRLLAHDQQEAADLIARYVQSEPPDGVYDTVLLPALNYAERDRIEGRLAPEEEGEVIEATRELIADAAEAIRRVGAGGEAAAAADGSPAEEPSPAADTPPPPLAREPLRVLGYAVNGASDEVALRMLVELVAGLPLEVEVTAERLQARELVRLAAERGIAAVCFADLPPSSPAKTRYLVSRLRAARPELPIVVGRWGPDVLADESAEKLRETGASHVSTSLLDTRGYLAALLEVPSAPAPPPRDGSNGEQG